MRKVRLVVQICNGARQTLLGDRLESVKAVNLCGYVIHGLRDIGRWAEGLVALFNPDGREVSGPVVHILKELTVDRSNEAKIV